MDAEAIVALAGRVLERHPDFDLEEALRLLHDASNARITDSTRHRLLERLGELNPVGGKLDNESFVARTRISKYALSQDPRFNTFWEELLQHTVRNDDWSTIELLERLGFLTCSEHRLFRFLEMCVHPLARTGEQQTSLVSAINGIVSVDGVELAPVDAISGEPVYRVVLRRSGVAGASKNIIFAAIGPKPEIIIRDAINNDIEIVKHEDKCLVYASPVPAGGLTWGVLVAWWAALAESADDRKQVAKNLSSRQVARVTAAGAAIHSFVLAGDNPGVWPESAACASRAALSEPGLERSMHFRVRQACSQD